MSKRKVDKTKKSNIKCEHCEAWNFEDEENKGWCSILQAEKNYWNRCKNFIWRRDI